MCKQSLVFAVVCLLSASCASLATAADDGKVSRCYSCKGIDCLRTTQNLIETCQYNQDDCVTIFNKFTVVAKGCLTSLPIELRQKCDDRSSPECRICNGNVCNSLGRSDFKCVECWAKDNGNCTKNPNALEPVQCQAPTSFNSYCFTDVASDGYVRRGCSLHMKQQRECLASKTCSLCSVEDGEGCNNLPKDNGIQSSGVALSGAVGLVAICAAVLFRL